MEAYFKPLINRFNSLNNTERAAKNNTYLRNKFESFGIDAKTRRNELKEFIRENKLPAVEDLEKCSLFLWNKAEREFQYMAIDLLVRMKKQLRQGDISWIETLIIEKSWWDTVDALAAWVCGTYFSLYPKQIKPIVDKWMKSENMWLQRTCLLFQLKYKKETDTDLLQSLILRLAGHPDFFIRKAIGWVLREHSKTDPAWVKNFLHNNTVSALSRKEGSKYI